MGMDASATICYGIKVDFDKIEDIHEDLKESYDVGYQMDGSYGWCPEERNHVIYVKGTDSDYNWNNVLTLETKKVQDVNLTKFNWFCQKHFNITPNPSWLILCNYG